MDLPTRLRALDCRALRAIERACDRGDRGVEELVGEEAKPDREARERAEAKAAKAAASEAPVAA